MSVVIVKVHEDRIELGADTAVTYSDCGQSTAIDLKLFHVRGLTVGISGGAEIAVMFKHFLNHVEEFKESTETDMIHLMVAFREMCKELDVKLTDDNGNDSSQFIIVYKGRAWECEGLYVREITDTVVIGCGEAHARAALHVGASLEDALDAACALNVHCAYPVVIYDVSKKNDSAHLTMYDRRGKISTSQKIDVE